MTKNLQNCTPTYPQSNEWNDWYIKHKNTYTSALEWNDSQLILFAIRCNLEINEFTSKMHRKTSEKYERNLEKKEKEIERGEDKKEEGEKEIKVRFYGHI